MAEFPKVLCITCAEKILKKVHFPPKYFNNIKKTSKTEEKRENYRDKETAKQIVIQKERERERKKERENKHYLR